MAKKYRQVENGLTVFSHRDFDLAFRRHPVSGKLLVKKGDEAVKQGLKNLVLTDRYERPFRPEFGGNVRARLFDLFDSIVGDDFRRQLEIAIQNYESRRVKLEDDEITQTPAILVVEKPDQNGLAITIRFRSIVTLTQNTMDINLNRVR